jgi:hypothetical protein
MIKKVPKMLIKIQDFDDSLAQKLMQATGNSTGSKAVRFVATDYLKLLDTAEKNTETMCALELEVKRLTSIIENARASAADLLDKTSQTDIFAGESK